eukprot:1564134-Pleurochrysis_carterae.AAC.1
MSTSRRSSSIAANCFFFSSLSAAICTEHATTRTRACEHMRASETYSILACEQEMDIPERKLPDSYA